ncbi:ORF6C domain-containing protein [Oleiharenicola sp. Vm1]|uniref:ORF6C domain-containing protein n=1 Tax=Oleiharenicola sp. Vm1 TaxID=3398393 RepID=UPI0039F5DA44
MSLTPYLPLVLQAASVLREPAKALANHALKDVYEVVKAKLKARFASKPDATDALEKATAKPDSPARLEVLVEETEGEDISDDLELVHLLKHLATLLPASPKINVRVSGRGHRVAVAGRDVNIAEKHVTRHTLQTDESHLSETQKAKIQELVKDLAERLAGDDGEPNYAAAQVRLKSHFQVTSYHLIPAARFEEAVSYLKQQRAMNHARLRRGNPVAYRNGFYTGIWARAKSLGWGKPQVYAFAHAKLDLPKPITSLRSLGPNQLKWLAEAIQREEHKVR